MQKIIDFINYWLIRIGYYLRYNSFVNKLFIEMEFRQINYRLENKGYSLDKINNIMQRYGSLRKLKSQLETRESYVELNRTIADISNKTGIPQWQLRAKVKNDFNIDI